MRYSALMTALLLAGCGKPEPRVPQILASDGSAESVQALHDTAQDGDTITLPAGNFTWGKMVSISKGVTLAGAGETATKIMDGIEKGRFLLVTLSPHAQTRITQIGFANSAKTTETSGPAGGVMAIIGSNVDGSTFRFDHCRTDELEGDIVEDTVSGVFDHNFFNGNKHMRFYLMANKWNGATGPFGVGSPQAGDFGDASLADKTALGSGAACFFEDNTFIGTGTSGNDAKTVKGICDGQFGARAVFRHNQIHNGQISVHGTESGGHQRGVKFVEVYSNTFVLEGGYPAPPGPVGIRSGIWVVWGNRATGFPSGIRMPLNCYRTIDTFSPWGGADGKNPLDINTQESAYWSGSATANSSKNVVTIVPGLVEHQYKGYQLLRTSNLGNSADAGFALISDNSSDSITWQNGVHHNMTVQNGDTLEIRRVIHALDQPGRTGGTLNNPSGAAPSFASGANDQVTEPCYSWDNRRTEDMEHTFNFDGGQTHLSVRTAGDQGVTRTEEQHFFSDLQAPDYAPYIYPHPLASGAQPTPAPTPNPTPGASSTVAPSPSPSPTQTATATVTPSGTAIPSSTPALPVVKISIQAPPSVTIVVVQPGEPSPTPTPTK